MEKEFIIKILLNFIFHKLSIIWAISNRKYN